MKGRTIYNRRSLDATYERWEAFIEPVARELLIAFVAFVLFFLVWGAYVPRRGYWGEFSFAIAKTILLLIYGMSLRRRGRFLAGNLVILMSVDPVAQIIRHVDIDLGMNSVISANLQPFYRLGTFFYLVILLAAVREPIYLVALLINNLLSLEELYWVIREFRLLVGSGFLVGGLLVEGRTKGDFAIWAYWAAFRYLPDFMSSPLAVLVFSAAILVWILTQRRFFVVVAIACVFYVLYVTVEYTSILDFAPMLTSVLPIIYFALFAMTAAAVYGPFFLDLDRQLFEKLPAWLQYLAPASRKYGRYKSRTEALEPSS